MPMPREFADWYRAASISPPETLLAQRWNGIEEATTTLALPAVVDLLRLFSIPQQSAYMAPDFLDAAFRKHDAAFPRKGNLEELRVLAGSILRHAIETNHPTAIAAALGLVSSSYGQLSLSAPEHVVAAEKFLSERAATIRDVGAAPIVEVASLPRETFDELMPTGHFAANQTQNILEPLFTLLTEQASRIAQGFKTYEAALWRTIEAQREELNLLWWLQAKWSRDLEKPFGDCTLAQACLVFAAEIADRSVFIPGPTAVLGILIEALKEPQGSQEGIAIVDAVNSAPRRWRQVRAERHLTPLIHDLCPILLAMSKSLETEGERDWLPVYRRYCNVQIDQAARPINTAYQVYRELMFSRSILGTKT